MDEPHIDDLVRAQNAVCYALDGAGSLASALNEMIELRCRKTTWVGKFENDTRSCIDNMLDELAPGWRATCKQSLPVAATLAKGEGKV
jgi:hypothetical protein